MSLSTSKCWYSNNCLHFVKACCSVKIVGAKTLTPETFILMTLSPKVAKHPATRVKVICAQS